MRVINAYTVRPCDIQSGDVMMYVIKALVVRPGVYRLYLCVYEAEDVPQGARITHEAEVCAALFPSLAEVAQPDPF